MTQTLDVCISNEDSFHISCVLHVHVIFNVIEIFFIHFNFRLFANLKVVVGRVKLQRERGKRK